MREVSKAEYLDHKTLDALLRDKVKFGTPRATSYYAARAGVRGVRQSMATWMFCPLCRLSDSSYTVFSYQTVMYRSCNACNNQEVNMAWYSVTTRVLQEALARVYPSCAGGLEVTDTLVEEARKLWRREQQRGHIATNRARWMDAYGMPSRARKASIQEMIEFYLAFGKVG